METGAASVKSKPASSVESKPAGFNRGNGADKSSDSVSFFDTLKERFQDTLAEVQEAERAREQTKSSSDASRQTIDVNANEVKASDATSGTQHHTKAQATPKKKTASKKKRKNRTKRR